METKSVRLSGRTYLSIFIVIMKISKSIISLGLTLLFLISAIAGYTLFVVNKKSAVKNEQIIYISSSDTYDSVFKKLKPELKYPNIFEYTADLKDYAKYIKPGRYKIGTALSTMELINKLRSGDQDALNLKFNNQDYLEDLAERISQQLDLTKEDLLNSMLDPDFLEKEGFTESTALNMYLPNSYQVYWTISSEDLIQKLLRAYRNYWTPQRQKLAEAQNLNPIEVSTLASIVQKESSYVPERATIAGLYLNRINRGIPLQADPTIIYSLKEKLGKDYQVKRVLTKDLSIASPYNTYLHPGLPKGPISMPDLSSIEAVLNPSKHRYIYMCANPEAPGRHNFARTLSEHNRNAKAYQRWLNKHGVKR